MSSVPLTETASVAAFIIHIILRMNNKSRVCEKRSAIRNKITIAMLNQVVSSLESANIAYCNNRNTNLFLNKATCIGNYIVGSIFQGNVHVSYI